MKILLCSSTFQNITHGPAKFAQLLLQINQLFPAHELRVLTKDIAAEIPERVYKVSWSYPRGIGLFWPYLDNFQYHRAIQRIRKEYPFEVLLFNNALVGVWSKWRKSSGVTIVGMLNDDDYLSARLRHFQWRKKWWIDFHRKPLERLATHTLDAVITNSKYLQRYVVEEYRANPSRVFQLYKAIDCAAIEFLSNRKIELNKRIKILFVKNDYPRGGLELLTRSLYLLKAYSFEVIVMGPFARDRETIESYFQEGDQVICDFRGPSAQEEVWEAMRTSDVFCVPAHKEGLGLANIEALAAGIPVVSTWVGGIPEVLEEGENGWLAVPEAKNLSGAIEACITASPEERAEKSESGRQHVAQCFSHLSMLGQLVAILEQVKTQYSG